MASVPAFRVHALTKRYAPGRPPANDAITLTIEAGELLGVFGPNGAGKTTLVRQMVGLLRPTSGEIQLFGWDVVRYPDVVPRLLAYYGQQTVALRQHTVREVLLLAGVLRGMPTHAARRQADELLSRFGLDGLATQRLSRLSGGQQRLAVLLSTFMADLPVWVLDEPTNELDPVMRQRVWEYLHEANAERAITVILTTHHLLEAEYAVGRVALIDGGRVVALGTPGELKRRVADRVRLEVRLRPGSVCDAEHRLAGIPGARRLRPGHWEVAAAKDEAPDLMRRLVDVVGLEALDDFRLITPTLEDVYRHVVGQAREGGEHAHGA